MTHQNAFAQYVEYLYFLKGLPYFILELGIRFHCTFEQGMGPMTVGSISIGERKIAACSKAQAVSLGHFSISIYRVIQRKKIHFWEVKLSVIARKSSYEHVCNSEWLLRKICLNLQN